MKKLFLILTTVATFKIFADNIESTPAVINTNATYISKLTISTKSLWTASEQRWNSKNH